MPWISASSTLRHCEERRAANRKRLNVWNYVKGSHEFTTDATLLLLPDPSLYAPRNTSTLQIAIKADVTPR